MKDQKFKIIIGVLVLVILAMLCFCITLWEKERDIEKEDSWVPYREEYITREQAIQIALDDLFLSQDEVYDLDVDLEKKYNTVVYEVSFDYRALEYEYLIDALNGNILKSLQERD